MAGEFIGHQKLGLSEEDLFKTITEGYTSDPESGVPPRSFDEVIDQPLPASLKAAEQGEAGK
ncbi:MAG: hypothetical protein WCT03_24720 [Candidatus Obscuribacterales bacterium]|jgi:hypothetical protein